MRFHSKKKGLFKTIPSDVPLELDAADLREDGMDRKSSVHFPGSDAPLYILAAQPAPDRIRALGNQINEVGWSSFSFQALSPPFRFYVLSNRVAPPQEQYCTDAHPRKPSEMATTLSPQQKKRASPSQIGIFALLSVSLLLNVGLLLRKSEPPSNSVPPSPCQEKPLLTDEMREQVKVELRNELLNKCGGKRLELEKVHTVTPDLSPAKFRVVILCPDDGSLVEENVEKIVNLYIDFVNKFVNEKGTNP